MVQEDSLHHMDLFDMGFMVIWRYRNSSYSPRISAWNDPVGTTLVLRTSIKISLQINSRVETLFKNAKKLAI